MSLVFTSRNCFFDRTSSILCGGRCSSCGYLTAPARPPEAAPQAGLGRPPDRQVRRQGPGPVTLDPFPSVFPTRKSLKIRVGGGAGVGGVAACVVLCCLPHCVIHYHIQKLSNTTSTLSQSRAQCHGIAFGFCRCPAVSGVCGWLLDSGRPQFFPPRSSNGILGPLGGNPRGPGIRELKRFVDRLGPHRRRGCGAQGCRCGGSGGPSTAAGGPSGKEELRGWDLGLMFHSEILPQLALLHASVSRRKT